MVRLPGGWLHGLSARINHSSNLREITPCNHPARFVISGPRRVKYEHAVARARSWIGIAALKVTRNVRAPRKRYDYSPFLFFPLAAPAVKSSGSLYFRGS